MSTGEEIPPHRGRLLAQLAYVSRLLLLVVLSVALLEGAVRLMHGGARSMLPSTMERGWVSSLPPDMDIWVRMPGRERVRYVTDGGGARVLAPEAAGTNAAGGVLVVGDSQALGWSMPFEQTFGSLLAQKLLGEPSRARVLAAASLEPESEHFLLGRYLSQVPGTPAASVVVFNLGNDLEEMYLGRQAARPPGLWGLSEWLGLHSFLFLDITLVRGRLMPELEGGPPGLNHILLALDPDERVVLAEQAVNFLRDTARLTGAARQAVLVIPNDYELEPSEFDKYARYYRDPLAFQRWRERVGPMAEGMRALEHYVIQRLRSQGVTVVSLSELIQAQGHTGPLYDKDNHHISPEAHALVAQALARELAEHAP